MLPVPHCRAWPADSAAPKLLLSSGLRFQQAEEFTPELTLESIGRMKVDELKQELRRAGLGEDGKKAALVERLSQHVMHSAEDAAQVLANRAAGSRLASLALSQERARTPICDSFVSCGFAQWVLRILFALLKCIP